MAKEIVVAKFTHEGKLYIGKREMKLYDESTSINGVFVKHANQGLRLEVQRSVREALKVTHGLKQVSSGGESVDLSAIESV